MRFHSHNGTMYSHVQRGFILQFLISTMQSADFIISFDASADVKSGWSCWSWVNVACTSEKHSVIVNQFSTDIIVASQSRLNPLWIQPISFLWIHSSCQISVILHVKSRHQSVQTEIFIHSNPLITTLYIDLSIYVTATTVANFQFAGVLRPRLQSGTIDFIHILLEFPMKFRIRINSVS